MVRGRRTAQLANCSTAMKFAWPRPRPAARPASSSWQRSAASACSATPV
jgi:hypothetical protein